MSKQNKAVISLHGIRTRGVWQKELVPELALSGFIPYVLDYGHFSALQLLQSGSLDRKVRWLIQQYDQIRKDSNCDRPNVIAHSFGTLQIARLLAKYSDVQFDTIILAAGIIPREYNWSELLDQKRVEWVVNEYGGQDIWPTVAKVFVPNAGDSGTRGFIDEHRALHQVHQKYHNHSDYFSKGNFRKNWLPTLLLDKRTIIDNLQSLLIYLSDNFNLKQETLRCFLMTVPHNSDYLSVIPGLHIGQTTQNEVGLAIPLDKFGPGSAPAYAFNHMREVTQTYRDIQSLRRSFGKNDSPIPEKVRWSISLPILSPDSMDKAIAILHIDCQNDLTDHILDKPLMLEQHVTQTILKIGGVLKDSLSI